jgi:hypothetical protein
MTSKTIISYLESLEIDEVYLYYDKPIFFSCRDSLGHIFLVLLVQDDEQDVWIYLEISERRYLFMRTGGIDLFSIFGEPESGFIYLVETSQEQSITNYNIVSAEEIKREWLPEPGEYMHVETPLSKEPIKQVAIQTLREIIRLKFNFHRYQRMEAPAKILGEIISTFQSTLNDIGLALSNQLAPMLVVGFNPGSFEVEFQSENQVNLLDESFTGMAMDEMISLMRLVDDLPALKDRLSKLSIDAAEQYLEFLKTIAPEIKRTNIEWQSPLKGYGGTATLSDIEVSQMISAIEMSEISETRIYEFVGRLRALNLNTRYFLLRSEDGIEYSGYISKDIIDSKIIQKAQLNRSYDAVIEEKDELKAATGKISTQVRLVKLDDIENRI